MMVFPALLLVPGLVVAASAADPPPAEPVARDWPSRTLAFVDAPGAGDCEPLPARAGLCIERVDFSAAMPDGDAVWARAAARRVSEGHAWLHQDLALRWFTEDALLDETLRTDTGPTLSAPPAHWDTLRTARGRPYSVPERADFLGQDAWLGARYPKPRYGSPPEITDALTVPDVVVLRGRFAERLGADGRPHPFDWMDGDARSSAPFFEQIFPYAAERHDLDRFGVPSTPLQPFQNPERLLRLVQGGDFWTRDPASRAADLRALGGGSPHDVPVLLDGTLGDFEAAVDEQFGRFARLVGVVIARYAIEEHTVNQMRVLTALTAMRSPPLSVAEARSRDRRLNASARGETDVDALASTDALRAGLSLEGGFALKLETLPDEVLDDWILRLLADRGAERDTVAAFQARVSTELGFLLRPNAAAVPGLEPDIVDRWLNDALDASASAVSARRRVREVALGMLLDRLEGFSRDEAETGILLDHVNHQVREGILRTGGAGVPPKALAEAGTNGWRFVLDQHGRVTRPLEQGLRAVDPTAVCTRAAGTAALAEPSFGAIHIDLWIDGADETASARELLWTERARLPFLVVDNAFPEIAVIADLPGDRALFRLRWPVWSGWHVLWAPQALPGGGERLSAKTAAVCDDLVLAPPALAPTALRAALLADGPAPTDPVHRTDLTPAQRVTLRKGERARAAQKRAGEAGGAELAAGLAPAEPILPRRGLPNQLPPAEAQAYLRESALGPLRAEAGPDGLLVFVHDIDPGADARRASARRPRTPYLQARARVRGRGEVEVVDSSSWALFFPPTAPAPVLVSPAWRETETTALADHPMPRWKRRVLGEWMLGGGLSMFPIRQVQSTCAVGPGDQHAVAPCPAEGLPPVRSEGFGLEGIAGWSTWIHDQPRIAIDTGIEARLDVLHGGPSWFWPTEPPTVFAWSFRPAAGPVVGVRFAPAPSPLSRLGRSGRTWGADQPDGQTLLRRVEGGARVGTLFGPGFGSWEITWVGDAWAGWSVRSPRSPRAALTPYRPGLLIGPFARVQVATPLQAPDPAETVYALERSTTWLVGARATFRLRAPPPAAPAPPAPPAPPKSPAP